jgi:myo-inositol-1(or 4)-monophosphatase
MLKETLINATEAGAAVLKHYFNSKNLKISNKEGINNLVTEADHAAEKAIMDTIREKFPDHFILSEEAGEIASASDHRSYRRHRELCPRHSHLLCFHWS